MVGMPLLVAATLAAASPDPSAIVDGNEVGTCGWPSATEVFVNAAQCTGVLVHPRVVLLTDACPNYSPGSDINFVFGDNGGHASTNEVAEECVFDDAGFGFCTLVGESSVPYAPILFGCERPRLAEGSTVTLVGYGTSVDGTFDNTKRYAELTVGSIFAGLFTATGSQGPCTGDQGAPAFVQLDDGSWRVAGIVDVSACNNSTTLFDLGTRVEWLESESGFDLTPCHDANGLPDPSPECGGFFAGGSGGEGDWGNRCAGAPVGGDGGACSGDVDPPSVSITAPIDGKEYDDAPKTVTIDVEAGDGDGLGVRDVRLEIGGMLLPNEDLEAPYSFTVELPLGEWSVVAVARDWGGGVGMSTPVTLWVGIEAPEGGSSEDSGSGGDASTSTSAATSTGPDGGSSSDGSSSEIADAGSESSGDAGLDETASGCGCRTARSFPLPLLLVIPLLVRRRRSTEPVCVSACLRSRADAGSSPRRPR